MRPLFTIHAGEYLVGSHIEKRFKRIKVWVPSKDTGIDLLLTGSKDKKKLGIQVKFSKDFLAPNSGRDFHKEFLAFGWWTLNRKKIKNSEADFWIFVLYSFDRRKVQYLMIKPKKLLSILTSIHGNTKTINVYFLVTVKNKCWETRGLSGSDHERIARDKYSNPIRNVTRYLNDWGAIRKRLI